MTDHFTPTTLPAAVRKLFELNSYKVDGPLQIHGAEVDLVATPRTDPFATPIYLEVTVEYVDNDKYGGDLTKLAMVREKEPSARCVIISSKGFTLAVAERAKATRIETLTYDDLFSRFERFQPYVTSSLGGTRYGDELATLNGVYEEPDLVDKHGTERATSFLTSWRDKTDSKTRWLILVGEYGTGKTALTKILQHRWLSAYRSNPALPIPFRIELRDFTRQFDAIGLLHHFLDHNALGDIPVEFVFSLIRSGRIVLLLDGYDEMAQYMHARERRACLEALAQLSSEGARGILTSRPNYFSEAEELQLVEILYQKLKVSTLAVTQATREMLNNEKRIDDLLAAHFVERYERSLRDLTTDQTESLVKRVLREDPVGQSAVLAILRRVFRGDASSKTSLSGKPVIISYLLEVVEGLKAHSEAAAAEQISEWQIYRLIVEQLMNRDFVRSPDIAPERRRSFLRLLSVTLSNRDYPILNETAFRDLIRQDFKVELGHHLPASREEEVERLFSNLRSSATLTREAEAGQEGWKFSHNSLREFFLTELLIDMLETSNAPKSDLPISDPMRLFASALETNRLRELGGRLATVWANPDRRKEGSLFLSLLWDGLTRIHSGEAVPAEAALRSIAGSALSLDGVSLSRVQLSDESAPANLESAHFKESSLSGVRFAAANLKAADFSNSVLEAVDFSGADLQESQFCGSLLLDVVLAGAQVTGADFRRIGPTEITIVVESDDGMPIRIEGSRALGYLRFNGAQTDNVSAVEVYRNHPKFQVAEKICRKLTEQGRRQRRGLVQRGTSRTDTDFAEAFLTFLAQNGLTTSPHKNLLALTEAGRAAVGKLLDKGEVIPALDEFLTKQLLAL